MQVSLVAPADVVAVWPKVEPHLEKVFALIKDTHHPIDIISRLLSGEYHLWIAHDGQAVNGATVAYVQHYPRATHYLCFLVAGSDLDEWNEPMRSAIEAHARAKGCKKVEGRGRAGWARAIGYDVKGALFEKEL